MPVDVDQEELGGPSAVSARHRALVLVDESLSALPNFTWRGDGVEARAAWRTEDGRGYGRFTDGDGLLWGSMEGAPGAGGVPGLPRRHQQVIDAVDVGETPGFCLWWGGARWEGGTPDGGPLPEVVVPLLSDDDAAAWVDRHHGMPELVDPLRDFLAVIAAGVPMTPHALAPFAADVEQLNALMRRAAELGLEAEL